MIIVFLLLVGATVRSAWGLNLLNESCDGQAEVQFEALGLESVTLCMYTRIQNHQILDRAQV